MQPIVQERSTKYSQAIRKLIAKRGHATNLELIDAVRAKFPDVSATTVHRITARLHERGEIALAPSGLANVLRYDANLSPHDHFMCEICGWIRDAQLGSVVRPAIEAAIGEDCSISGSLTVSGICKQCHNKEK